MKDTSNSNFIYVFNACDKSALESLGFYMVSESNAVINCDNEMVYIFVNDATKRIPDSVSYIPSDVIAFDLNMNSW